MSAGFWDSDLILELLEVWSRDTFQARLDSSYRNQEVFKDIANELKENNPHIKTNFTWQQCRNKIKTLRAEYRKVLTGRELRSTFPYFDILDRVLRNKPVYGPGLIGHNTLGGTFKEYQEQLQSYENSLRIIKREPSSSFDIDKQVSMNGACIYESHSGEESNHTSTDHDDLEQDVLNFQETDDSVEDMHVDDGVEATNLSNHNGDVKACCSTPHENRIVGVFLSPEDSKTAPGSPTNLGVVVIDSNVVNDLTLQKLRLVIYEQIKSLPGIFTFCSKEGWLVGKILETSVTLKEILTPDGVINIKTTYNKPKIGIKTKTGESVGFVFAAYHDSLESVRQSINKQILSGDSMTMIENFVFLDTNHWPISTEQEKMLSAIDVISGSCLTIHTHKHSNMISPALRDCRQDRSMSPDIPAKRRRTSEFLEYSPVFRDMDYHGNRTIKGSGEGIEKQILLSYVRAESAAHALNLKHELSSFGFSVYLDVHEIESGADWQDSLNNAISDCQVFVPLITPSYGQTQWTNREVKLADVLGKFILPINFLEEWPPRCLAIQFATTQYIPWKTPAQIKTEQIQGSETVFDYRIWENKFISSVAEKIKNTLLNGKKSKSILQLTRRKTIVKSCCIVKKSNDQAVTANREGRPLVVICLHPAQIRQGKELKVLLEGVQCEVWLSTELDISHQDSLVKSPSVLSENSTDNKSLSDNEIQNMEMFQEKADDAGVILAVVSKQFALSRTCQQQMYYCEQRKRMVALSCEVDRENYPVWVNMLLEQSTWQNVQDPDYKGKIVDTINYQLNHKTEQESMDRERISLHVKLLRKRVMSARGVLVSGNCTSEKLSGIYRFVMAHLASLDLTVGTFFIHDSVCGTGHSKEEREGTLHLVLSRELQDQRIDSGSVSSDRRVLCGETTQERDTIASSVFDACVVIGGDLSAEHLIESFLWRDKIIIPVLWPDVQLDRYKKIEKMPVGVKTSDWCSLSNAALSVEEAGKAVKEIVTAVLLQGMTDSQTLSPKQTSPKPLKSALKKHSPTSLKTSLSSQKTVILSDHSL